MKDFKKYFKNKKIIITGHTGFKGSWLTLWLQMCGAKIVGISKSIPTNPSHFKVLKLNKKILDKRMDISNIKNLKQIFRKSQPDFVFHFAAQSLVKNSYKYPVDTFRTNTIGTLNVLESLRVLKKKCTAILITSDKSYKNMEIKRGYREDDLLGGDDPYSSSKASAELVIQSYLKSYFSHKKNKILIGVARAGNVIGGGDWSKDRLIPDCVRSWSKGKKVNIRSPRSTRPWQHVLEAISGYLIFAIKLNSNKKIHGQAFNFGPSGKKDYKVINLVKLMKKYWKKISWTIDKKGKSNFKESNLLKLNCNKAKKFFGWRTILNFSETTQMVTIWYKNYYLKKAEVNKTSIDQIKKYERLLKKRL